MPALTTSAACYDYDLLPHTPCPPPPQRRAAMAHALSLPEILGHIFYCLDLSEEATANDYGLSTSGHVGGGLGLHGNQAPASSSASLLLSNKLHPSGGHDRMMCKMGSLRACALVSRFWYQACKPILWRKVHYSKSNLGAMVIHLQPYDHSHNKRVRSSRHTLTTTNNSSNATDTSSSPSSSSSLSSPSSSSHIPPSHQGDTHNRESKGESPFDTIASLSAISSTSGVDLSKYLLEQIPMGRFLPGMIQNARLIRHLKPWPGFLHRDLELIGDLCGPTLESLDLSLTRWSSSSHIDMVAHMTRHSTSSSESPPFAGHKDPIYISPVTTSSLEQLLSKLTRLQALSVNHAIGLDMNEVLRFLTRMFGEEWERIEQEDSLERRWTSRRGSSSSSSSSSSNCTRSSSSGSSSSSRRLSLRRFEMNGQQNYDEETLVAFLETCCAFPRQSTSLTSSDYISLMTGSTIQHSSNYVLKDSIPGIRSLSIKRNALSASLDSLWSIEMNNTTQSVDGDSTIATEIQSSIANGNGPGAGGGVQYTLPNNTTATKLPHQRQHHHGPLQLEELFLDNNNLSSLTLHNLTRRCPFLRTITLSNNRRLTSLGMHVLAEHCPLLTVVHLDGCISIDNGGFQQLFLRCTELEDVRLSRTSVDDVSILALLGQNHLASCSFSLSSHAPAISEATRSTEARGGGIWANQHGTSSHSSYSNNTTQAAVGGGGGRGGGRSTHEKRAKLRCIHLQNCPSVTERSVRALLMSCTSLESLDISQNRQLRVTELFGGSNTCRNCRPEEHGEWACSQSLRHLDMADIDYTPIQDQYELRACRNYDDVAVTAASSSTCPITTTHSRPGASTSLDAFYGEVERVYQDMYDQLAQLVHLQSLAIGSHDFVLVLDPSPPTGPTSPLSPSSPSLSSSLPLARDGLIRVLRSLKHLHLVSLPKIDPVQSTVLGFKELRWMIESMASPMMRQLLLGQGLGFSTGFGNGIVETNKRHKAAVPGGRRSPSPHPHTPSSSSSSSSSSSPFLGRGLSPEINGPSTASNFGITSTNSNGGSAMGLIDISCLPPPSLVATEESLVFSRQDQLDKMDEVDRDMDSSEAFMAWCRTTRPLLRVCVLEW